MITRRGFIVRWLWFALVLVLDFFRGPLRAVGEEIDYFSGTDFVGKTRAGRFQKFYINYWKPMRRIRAKTWTLEVTGLCERPRTFTLDELRSFPSTARVSRLKCVECWSASAEWQGFHLRELEKQVRPLPEAVGVVFHCADAYVETLSRDSLNQERTLLVYDMNGEPLSDEHGFPLRVIVPFKYGYKNPKAILKMEYVAEIRPGTWSRIGPYSTDGTILPGTDHPLDLGKVARRIPGGEIRDY